MPNRLARSTSPYLRQHADNPVDWYEWGDEAFAAAASRDVPVLLSVGYATCHWCHVMAHESFEDPDTAALMNERFVNVKVDREERPDVDRIYMDVVTAVTGRGGWPMTVFLTPEQKPIFAGTYFPKEAMGHHPSFSDVMTAVLDAWDSKRQDIVSEGDRIAAAIAERPTPGNHLPTIGDVTRAVESISRTFDRVHGGFGGAPKFPQAPTLELLLRVAALQPGSSAAKHSLDMLERQLTAMARGGIYDHLGGGFARYSVDAAWMIPHFEKMLYDNAQLAHVYLAAWQLTANEEYRRVGVEVLDYLDSTMADPAGGLHSAEDADSEGVEGKFAVWTWDELGSVLGDDRDLAAAIYGASPGGNFEGANNLHRAADNLDVAAATGLDVDDLADRKRSIDRRLRRARALRTPPSRDDKIVTAWNGLAIRAFAEAGWVLGVDRYTQRATMIAEFLTDQASSGRPLVRSWRDAPGHMAFADDHAALAVGLYTLYQTTGDERWFAEAETHVDELRRNFADPVGGFYSTSEQSEPLIARPKATQDNPTPSDNASAMEALLLHSSLTGDLSAVAEIEGTMRTLAADALRHPAFGGYALAVWLTHLVGVVELAIIGDPTEREPLVRAVRSRYKPHVVTAIGDGSHTAVPLLQGRDDTDGARAYVCRNLVCELPVRSDEELSSMLDGRITD